MSASRPRRFEVTVGGYTGDSYAFCRHGDAFQYDRKILIKGPLQ